MSEPEAVKADTSKPPLDLLPFDAITAVAIVMDYGAKKYAARNWEKGMAWGRMFAAALRHMFAWARGEDYDPESKLHHLAHASCCLLFLLAYVMRSKGTDDRVESP